MLIALLTDFGAQDTYVGMMKGVIAGVAPGAQVTDLSHGVPPQDLHAAAFALLTSYRYFPANTIFCCVVDPEVGSERLGVAARFQSQGVGPYFFVGRDNGVLTPVLHETPVSAAAVLDNPHYHLEHRSSTFHGRDIFAPAAAHLAAGAELPQLGSKLEPSSLTRLNWPEPTRMGESWQAQVVYTDGFGNLITNLKGEVLKTENWRVSVRATELSGLKETFSDVLRGAPLAYIGSSGFLELAVRDGNAAKDLHIGIGETVELRPISEDG